MILYGRARLRFPPGEINLALSRDVWSQRHVISRAVYHFFEDTLEDYMIRYIGVKGVSSYKWSSA